MPGCNKYIENTELISRLTDGDLDPEEEALLRAHMAGCEDCRKVYEAFTGISDAISDDIVTPPDSLSRGIMYKIDLQKQEQSRGRLRRFGWGKYTAIAAALAVVIFAASRTGLFSGSGRTSSVTEDSAPAVAEVMEESTYGAPDAESSDSDTAAAEPEPAEKAEEAPALCAPSEASETETARASAGDPSGSSYMWVSADISGDITLTVTDADILNFLYGNVMVCDDLTRCSPVPERDANFLLLARGNSGDSIQYSIWSDDNQLWWCESGSSTVMLSPVTADEFLTELEN